MQALPTGLRTHSQRVCNFYKRALRNLESWHTEFHHYRQEALLLRKQIDDNANIKDLRIAKDLLKKGEHFLEKTLHLQPKVFPSSPGGPAYEREVIPPDWILDYWDPIEKAAYPKYFALREKRKLEYIEFFNKQYPDAQKKFPPPEIH